MDPNNPNALTKYFQVSKSKKVKASSSSIKQEFSDLDGKLNSIVKDGKLSKQEPEALSKEEKLLIEFDMNYDYGPSQNLTRLERWDRAYRFNQNPPQFIKDLILSDTEKYLYPVWNKHTVLD